MMLTKMAFAQHIQLTQNFYSAKTTGDKQIILHGLIANAAKNTDYSKLSAYAYIYFSLSATNANDTLLHRVYEYMGDVYEATNTDSAVYYYHKALYTNTANHTLRDNMYRQQSLLYAYSSLYKKDSVVFYIKQLENTVGALADTNKQKLNIYNTLASSYKDINMYNDAINKFRFVITNATKSKDTTNLLNALANTGVTYNNIGNDRLAVFYTLQAVAYTGNNELSKMFVYNNLADYYFSLGVIDSAGIFAEKATAIAFKSGDAEAIHVTEFTKAIILMAKKNYAAAEKLFNKTYAYFVKQKPGTYLVNNLLSHAALDTLLGKFTKAEQRLIELYGYTKVMGQSAYTSSNLNFLAIVNARLGKYKEAYEYQNLYKVIDDSIRSEKVQQNFAILQTEYETYKKEEHINVLQKEGVIKDLELKAALRNKTLWVGLSIILLAAFLLILYIRSLRNKATLNNLKVELEMKALRSQMNPHFIFNSLNSIQKYIWENKQENASEYLTKFARLIRLVLENSLHETITLNDELDALRLYIEMEHRRNNQKFDYSITVAHDINGDEIAIPPLLLQPYVENAIWHGLSNKDTRGKLTVSISRSSGNIICSIEDDGIGRKKATAIKSDLINKKSLAMNISSERIAWLQQSKKANAFVRIIDKPNEDGTIIIITLPIIIAND